MARFMENKHPQDWANLVLAVLLFISPWVLGAYASVKPGHSGARQALAQPVDDRLFFAGEAVGMPMVATCGGAYWGGTQAIGWIAPALQPA